MKVGYNLTRYQMVEKRSSCKVSYSIHVLSVGKTDHGSILIQESVACSYANHMDMKDIIQWLIDDEKMSNDHAEVIEELSKLLSRISTTLITNYNQIVFLMKS